MQNKQSYFAFFVYFDLNSKIYLLEKINERIGERSSRFMIGCWHVMNKILVLVNNMKKKIICSSIFATQFIPIYEPNLMNFSYFIFYRSLVYSCRPHEARNFEHFFGRLETEVFANRIGTWLSTASKPVFSVWSDWKWNSKVFKWRTSRKSIRKLEENRLP